MNNLNTTISQNLIRLRKEKKVSFDKLSESSGVSKALLCQIERGDANPTINTLWKIAVGLQVAFGDLIQNNHLAFEVVKKKSTFPIIDPTSRMRLWPIFSNSTSPVGIFIAELAPFHIHNSAAHDANSKEYVFVIEGTIVLTVHDQSIRLEAGDTICFQSDQPHSYSNPESATAQFQCIFNRNI